MNRLSTIAFNSLGFFYSCRHQDFYQCGTHQHTYSAFKNLALMNFTSSAALDMSYCASSASRASSKPRLYWETQRHKIIIQTMDVKNACLKATLPSMQELEIKLRIRNGDRVKKNFPLAFIFYQFYVINETVANFRKL